MVGVVWMGAIALASISAILASFVIYMYYRILKYGHSRITMGHFMFASLLFLQSLIALGSYINLATRFGPEVGLPAVFISLTGALAVGFLVWAILQ